MTKLTITPTLTTRQQRRSDPWAAVEVIDCRCGKRHYVGWPGCPRSKAYIRPRASRRLPGLHARCTKTFRPKVVE